MAIDVTPPDQPATAASADTMILVMVCAMALIGLAALITMTG
jgi:hypothetical protein